MSDQTADTEGAGGDGAGAKGAATEGPETGACCSIGHGLTDDEMAADVEALTALGNDTRYEALRLIAAADGEVCVCEIEPELGVSQGAVSQALSRLFSSGLVERRKEGRWRYYATTPRADRLLRALDETRSVETDSSEAD